MIEAATRGVLQKMVFIKISQNSQENTCTRVSLLIKLQAVPATLLKKETLAQVFSWEFCVISKNTFFTEHIRMTASEMIESLFKLNIVGKLRTTEICSAQ